MSVINHPKAREAVVRQMMRDICADIDQEQAAYYRAGALSMLEMGCSIGHINRVARYTVGRAQIRETAHD